MQNPKSRKVSVTMTCGHNLIFDYNQAPKIKEILWCGKCRSEELCIAIEQLRWMIKCSDCNYKGVTSTHIELVTRSADRHRATRMHQVIVKRASK